MFAPRAFSPSLIFTLPDQRGGIYKLPMPRTLGNEAAGTVAAVGEGTEFQVGDRVAVSATYRVRSKPRGSGSASLRCVALLFKRARLLIGSRSGGFFPGWQAYTGGGAFAEYCVGKAQHTAKLATDVSTKTAATVLLQGLTGEQNRSDTAQCAWLPSWC